MATEMYAQLAIYGEQLNPDEISKTLDLSPDRSWRKGDPKGKAAFRKEGCWKIETQRSRDCEKDLNDHLLALLERIAPVKNFVAEFRKQFTLQFECIIEFDEQVPALHVDHSVLKAMSELGAEFDIDGYLFGS